MEHADSPGHEDHYRIPAAHPLPRHEEVQKRQTQKEVWTYLQQICIWLYERRRAPSVEPHGARDYDQCF